MPVPIRLNRDCGENNKLELDYSFLFQQQVQPTSKKTVIASNKDAELLYSLWERSETTGKDTFKINTASGISPKDILTLKARGFITGGVDELKFTQRGRVIVTTIALSEPNNFAKNAERKGYSEILASMDKRGKKGYRLPKYAANTSNFLRLS
jgi:hypothetical protein